MNYPSREGIVEVRKKGKAVWTVALYYKNGLKPVFAQYGSEITDQVEEWRYKSFRKAQCPKGI